MILDHAVQHIQFIELNLYRTDTFDSIKFNRRKTIKRKNNVTQNFSFTDNSSNNKKKVE